MPGPDPRRKKNPRAELQTQFLDDLAEDWKEHGKGAIRIMRIERPAEYVKVVAALMPREVELDLANYVARVPVNIIDLDEWQTLNQDLITKRP